jgi:hypothetical protein
MDKVYQLGLQLALALNGQFNMKITRLKKKIKFISLNVWWGERKRQ